jgi:hypothetical protein
MALKGFGIGSIELFSHIVSKLYGQLKFQRNGASTYVT